jgi:hypothetical protein
MSTKKVSITLEASDAKYLADGMLAAMSRDDVTPVLCTAHISFDGELVVAVATDRYRAHRVFVNAVSKSSPVEFMMPRAAVEWLSKNAGAFSKRGSRSIHPKVDIEFTPGAAPDVRPNDNGVVRVVVRHDVTCDSLAFSTSGVRGNFPPVYKLIDKARDAKSGPASGRLNLTFMGKLSALEPYRGFPSHVKFTDDDDTRKPAPVYISYVDDMRIYADAILQPNLEAR